MTNEEFKILEVIKSVAETLHDTNLIVGVLLAILEEKEICTRKQVFAAKSAASARADQIIAEENQRNRAEGE
jgi:hypothetical protein